MAGCTFTILKDVHIICDVVRGQMKYYVSKLYEITVKSVYDQQ
jgi:hypothetical protein